MGPSWIKSDTIEDNEVTSKYENTAVFFHATQAGRF